MISKEHTSVNEAPLIFYFEISLISLSDETISCENFKTSICKYTVLKCSKSFFLFLSHLCLKNKLKHSPKSFL